MTFYMTVSLYCSFICIRKSVNVVFRCLVLDEWSASMVMNYVPAVKTNCILYELSFHI